MNTTTWYCRLCAGLTLRAKLVNLQTDEKLCEEVIKKLSRFHITMDFQDNILPKTVCDVCIKSLDHAFKFICAVDEAQGFLSDFVLVKCSETSECDLEQDTISYELVDTNTCDPMEISVKDCYSNDQVKFKVDNRDDCINYIIKKELEIVGLEPLVTDTCSTIDHKVTEIVDIKSNIPLNNNPDDNIENNTIIVTTHEEVTNHDVHVISQDEKTSINASATLEDQKNTVKKKNTKKIKLKTPTQTKKTTEPKNVPNTGNYTENEVNELIKNLDYVPEQYITKTWQDYLWQCSQCGTQFTNMEDLQKHSMEFHNSCSSYK
ncbi:uncharacterized protein LOC111349900 [Spodoptera litura]|uniref:Uncharacterized protein LOC111349900 n=1 Tax=Spodoptera litura TaxID=69820 RepID=A0A9J7IN10_SPOLT|nr:uncharacterized protein LOC111349900 [Spodoptera litura]